jgi:hypothetical protein
MRRWYMKVKTADGVKISEFYHSDTNPIKNHPERFDHTFINLPNGKTVFEYVDEDNISDQGINKDDIRYTVDELNINTKYWIVDAYDKLGDYYPAVPDVPGHPHPTNFVAIPRESVLDVFSD